MFDDQQLKSQPPSNLPTEPDDMFDGVENAEKIPDALSAGLLKKKEGGDSFGINQGQLKPTYMPDTGSMYEMKQPILGKVLMVLIILVLLGGIGFGGWYLYNNFVMPTTNTVAEKNIVDSNENKTEVPVADEEIKIDTAIDSNQIPAAADVSAKMNNDKILFGESVDSDKDGLDDVREKEIGTDPKKSDTDEDGLNDNDEVIIWKTNPLVIDTDGDTYKDGEEVKNGYNPLGAGKLFNIPAGANTSTVSTTENIAK